MAFSIERSLGWLADLIAQHLYKDDVPQPMRRRWSFDGAAWTITDDPDDEVARFELSGDFTDTPAEFDEITADEVIVNDFLNVANKLTASANGTQIGDGTVPVAGQGGALLLSNIATPAPAAFTGVLAWAQGDELWAVDSSEQAAIAHFRKLLNSAGYVDLDGSEGVRIFHDGNPVATWSFAGSRAILTADAADGFGFEALATSQYMYFRTGNVGNAAIYFDSPTLNWRSYNADTDYLTLSVSSTTRIIGIPARTTNGTGADIRIQPQPVNAGRSGIDLPGSINLDFGQVIGSGTESSGRLNFRDHLGPAVNYRFIGISAEAATHTLVIEGAAAGTDGRVRGVGMYFASPTSLGFSAGAANTDLTIDSTTVTLRCLSVNAIAATANGQCLGGAVEAAQNGSLRLAQTGVPSAAATAGVYLWNDNGHLRTRDQRNVISEVSTGKRSTTFTPAGPTRCFDRTDIRSMSGATTLDMLLISSTELPASGTKWTMRCEVEWALYDTDGDAPAGGKRRATIYAAAGTFSVATAAADQVDGIDDDLTAGVITLGAGLFLRESSGDLVLRFTTTGSNVVSYVSARIIATLWQPE